MTWVSPGEWEWRAALAASEDAAQRPWTVADAFAADAARLSEQLQPLMVEMAAASERIAAAFLVEMARICADPHR